jgi:hypothetical protein
MSAQVVITQLPSAGAITGTEAVPIVQNGVTVQTTTGAIAGSPTQTYSYLTVSQTPQLPNSRYVGVTNGLAITDGGAQGLFNISTTGALLSLVNSGTGIQVKTSSTAITGRSVASSGAGLSVTNGDGIAGNPTVALSGLPSALANLSGSGMVALVGGTSLSPRTITGTTNQISLANGNGQSGDPTISIADNVVLPGTGAATVVSGTTAQKPTGSAGQFRYNTSTARFEGYQSGNWYNFGVGDGTVTSVSGTAKQISVANSSTTPQISISANAQLPGVESVLLPSGATSDRPISPINGMLRYNTTFALFEGYINSSWQSLAAGSGVTSVATGTGLTGGPITSTGSISIADTAVTAGNYGSNSQVPTYTVNAQGQLTAAANVSISATAIGAVTSVSGTANEITSTGGQTPVLSLPSALTFTGKTVTGGAFNMTSATVGSDTVTTNTATQTLTGKTISGASNTFTNIPNSGLTNSSITLGTTNISLGGTSLTPAGLTSVTVTQDPTSALQLATKQYVDTQVSTGLAYHQPVQVATTQSLAAQTGGTVTYNNGSSGVGATITLSVALTVLDGYTLANTNRILVKDEVNQAYNGVYTWATGGTVLTRSTDTNSYGPGTTQLSEGDYFFTQNGTVNKGNSYVCSTVGTITFGTTAITFSQFSTSQVYSGGTGINVSGTVISLSNTAVTAGSYGSATQVGTFTVNAQGQLTLAGNTTVTPAVGSITGLGTGVATALAVNTGSAGAFVVNGGALGTPSSGTVTNLTGTASININGTVGATTANTGAFTTISATGVITSTVATGTAPFTVASTTQVANLNAATAGTATNATNTGITANSTNAANYLTFVSATTGNLPQLVNSSITCNPSTGAITGGISGGTF